MKNYILFIALIISLSACSDKTVLESQSLVGDWGLTATYADLGDGSGKWNYDMYTVIQKIAFKANGEFSKKTIDGFDYISYQIKDNENVIFKTSKGEELTMRYTLENDVLTLYPTCREGCGFKFGKLNK